MSINKLKDRVARLEERRRIEESYTSPDEMRARLVATMEAIRAGTHTPKPQQEDSPTVEGARQRLLAMMMATSERVRKAKE
jgi:hypothetical protein